MERLSPFCTCTSTDCPFHPSSHDKGCSLCIAKNLGRREIPSCFFELAGGAGGRSSYTFEDFAKAILGDEDHGT